ncbi:unnamed protein product [Ilex paraguariensis]|uniref:Uncharacterized protein n=1 Tax=Ilex paraguariensis TaxID=185542 RepID=A0ABC8RRG9_9AQUA
METALLPLLLTFFSCMASSARMLSAAYVYNPSPPRPSWEQIEINNLNNSVAIVSCGPDAQGEGHVVATLNPQQTMNWTTYVTYPFKPNTLACFVSFYGDPSKFVSEWTNEKGFFCAFPRRICGYDCKFRIMDDERYEVYDQRQKRWTTAQCNNPLAPPNSAATPLLCPDNAAILLRTRPSRPPTPLHDSPPDAQALALDMPSRKAELAHGGPSSVELAHGDLYLVELTKSQARPRELAKASSFGISAADLSPMAAALPHMPPPRKETSTLIIELTNLSHSVATVTCGPLTFLASMRSLQTVDWIFNKTGVTDPTAFICVVALDSEGETYDDPLWGPIDGYICGFPKRKCRNHCKYRVIDDDGFEVYNEFHNKWETGVYSANKTAAVKTCNE